MSSGLPSDEVADDYKNSLEDLVNNDRYQIGNLTVIAKENIEHGEAIARVLENHIRRAPPARKLPAIYVLDSIVKNVGTPYTVYFGRNLYNTFMNAYTLVDGSVRKKLDETLNTWRSPVPGSLSPTPVFRLDVTQRIVDALAKARQAAQQAQNRHPLAAGLRVIPQQAPYRSTPTPPAPANFATRPGYPTVPQPLNQNGITPYTNGAYSSQAQADYHAPPPLPQYPTPQYSAAAPSPAVDLAALHHDIDDLIIDAKIECASHPMDRNAQTKLSSLQSLKNIVEMGRLSDRDLLDVRKSVSDQLAQRNQAAKPTPPIPTPQPQLPAMLPYGAPPPHLPPPSATPSFLNSNNLAELIRATANGGRPTPPPAIASASFQPPYNSTPPAVPATPVPPLAENSLIAQLRASGILTTTPTPPQRMKTAGSIYNQDPVAASTPFLSVAAPGIKIEFTTASIRVPRPQLYQNFFSTRPNICNTCGRRFTADEVGKEKKAKHLDWHFKTKMRMAEAEKRGQSRSWYVDERGWISSKEYDDGEGPPDEEGGSLLSPSRTKVPDFVRVPNDPALKNLPCPIDQEPFSSFWSDDLQEFIWTDAVQVGARIYHASCYRQVMSDQARGTTPVGGMKAGRGSTPDSVLGKRKAAEEANGTAAKVKVENR